MRRGDVVVDGKVAMEVEQPAGAQQHVTPAGGQAPESTATPYQDAQSSPAAPDAAAPEAAAPDAAAPDAAAPDAAAP